MWRGAGTPRMMMDNGGSLVFLARFFIRKEMRLGSSGESVSVKQPCVD
jgi:hypothetical protein